MNEIEMLLYFFVQNTLKIAERIWSECIEIVEFVKNIELCMKKIRRY